MGAILLYFQFSARVARVLQEGSRDLIKGERRTERRVATSRRVNSSFVPVVPVFLSQPRERVKSFLLLAILEDHSKTRENATHVYDVDSVRPSVCVKVRQATLIPVGEELSSEGPVFSPLLVHRSLVCAGTEPFRPTDFACMLIVEKSRPSFIFQILQPILAEIHDLRILRTNFCANLCYNLNVQSKIITNILYIFGYRLSTGIIESMGVVTIIF